MVRDPDDEYQSALDGLDKAVEDGEIVEADASAIKQLCYAFDAEDARENLPTDMYESRRAEHVKASTRRSWATRLKYAANDVTLTEADADDINSATTEWVKDEDGPGKAHIRNVENALSKFYRYHDDLGVDPQSIVKHKHGNEGNGWDARDLLDADERAALRSVCDHPRDRAMYHLALYCGLRNTALRTLRVEDIDLENGEWYFNTDADGLKDIHEPNKPRPLFQAERAVRDWMKVHPNPEPNAPLIAPKSGSRITDYSNPISRESIRHAFDVLKKCTHCPECRGEGVFRGEEECGTCNGTGNSDTVMAVNKPCHPHMMRHNFVSMCRQHPDITDADIKFFIGHAPGSDVMETTYSHISSDDHNKRGKGAFGTTNAAPDDDDTSPWDSTCNTCHRVLHPGEDVCDECGTERGPTPWDDAPTEASETYMERMERKMEEMFEEKVGNMLESPEPDISDPQERAREIEEKLDMED